MGRTGYALGASASITASYASCSRSLIGGAPSELGPQMLDGTREPPPPFVAVGGAVARRRDRPIYAIDDEAIASAAKPDAARCSQRSGVEARAVSCGSRRACWSSSGTTTQIRTGGTTIFSRVAFASKFA